MRKHAWFAGFFKIYDKFITVVSDRLLFPPGHFPGFIDGGSGGAGYFKPCIHGRPVFEFKPQSGRFDHGHFSLVDGIQDVPGRVEGYGYGNGSVG